MGGTAFHYCRISFVLFGWFLRNMDGNPPPQMSKNTFNWQDHWFADTLMFGNTHVFSCCCFFLGWTLLQLCATDWQLRIVNENQGSYVTQDSGTMGSWTQIFGVVGCNVKQEFKLNIFQLLRLNCSNLGIWKPPTRHPFPQLATSQHGVVGVPGHKVESFVPPKSDGWVAWVQEWCINIRKPCGNHS